MAGFAGIVGHDSRPAAARVAGLTQALLAQAKSRTDSWHGERAAICSVGAGRSASPLVFDREHTRCIAFFGECFDYGADKAELVRRGQDFASGESDAEFCLKLYEAFGDDAFARLDGSYSLAIVDVANDEAVLVSDRMGTRPLFYGLTPEGSLVFGTQLGAVLSAPGVDRALDTSAVVEFCCLQRVVGTKTYHRGVQVLPPATVLRYRSGRVTLAPYWRFAYRPQPGSRDDYAAELGEVMRRMARRIARGNARVAMLLSGGLDARMVLAAAEQELACFTFGDYLNPEAITARDVARARGFPFHFLQRGPDHYANLLDAGVEMGSGMHPFNHAHAIGFIEALADDYDVVTHGYVPELLFRGSSLPKLPRRAWGVELGERLDPSLDESNLPQRMFQRGYTLLGTRAPELFSAELRKTLDETLLESARQMIAEAADASANTYDRFLWPDVHYHGRYPSMLFELSLRHFMTERSIVFGNEVLELHLRMPVALRADNRLWLAAMARLNGRVARVRNANTGHPATMPVALASTIDAAKVALRRMPLAWRIARKAEASVPSGLSPISWPRFDWMIRHNDRLRQVIVDTLHDPAALPPELFDHDRVRLLLDDHLAGRGNHRTILFALVTFGRWHKQHGRQ